MPLSPNLDDRTYDDLVDEGIAMLPRYAPAWTNRNPSDPGITLIELLAYFTDHLMFRVNRVTREVKQSFVKLLVGVEQYETIRWEALPGGAVDDRLRDAVRAVRTTERLVTVEDYEHLTRRGTSEVLRARAFARRNLDVVDGARREADAPGHVSVVVLPAAGVPPDSTAALVTEVREYLEPRRLLGTRLHVVPPFFVAVRLGAKLVMRPDASVRQRTAAPEHALRTLEEYVNASPGGGPEREGWPFGRALYLSEIYATLEQVPGVDYVEDVDVVALSDTDAALDERTRIGVKVGRSVLGVDSWSGVGGEQWPDRILMDGSGKLVGIRLRSYELIRLASRAEDFSTAGTAPASPGAQPSS